MLASVIQCLLIVYSSVTQYWCLSFLLTSLRLFCHSLALIQAWEQSLCPWLISLVLSLKPICAVCLSSVGTTPRGQGQDVALNHLTYSLTSLNSWKKLKVWLCVNIFLTRFLEGLWNGLDTSCCDSHLLVIFDRSKPALFYLLFPTVFLFCIASL